MESPTPSTVCGDSRVGMTPAPERRSGTLSPELPPDPGASCQSVPNGRICRFQSAVSPD